MIKYLMNSFWYFLPYFGAPYLEDEDTRCYSRRQADTLPIIRDSPNVFLQSWQLILSLVLFSWPMKRREFWTGLFYLCSLGIKRYICNWSKCTYIQNYSFTKLTWWCYIASTQHWQFFEQTVVKLFQSASLVFDPVRQIRCIWRKNENCSITHGSIWF